MRPSACDLSYCVRVCLTGFVLRFFILFCSWIIFPSNIEVPNISVLKLSDNSLRAKNVSGGNHSLFENVHLGLKVVKTENERNIVLEFVW